MTLRPACRTIVTSAFIIAALLLPLADVANALQAGSSSAVIVASKSVAVSGERVTLSALVLDSAGGVRPATNVSWFSSNPGVASISPDGVASTRVLGVSTIHAVADGIRSQDLLFQVVPSKIDLSAPRIQISVGEELQLRARVLDINGNPLDAPNLQWDLFFGDGNGADGSLTTMATIDNAGLLKTFARGLVSIRAFIRYPVVANGPSIFDAYLQISVTPKGDYRLTRLMATDPVSRTFKLRPNYVSS